MTVSVRVEIVARVSALLGAAALLLQACSTADQKMEPPSAPVTPSGVEIGRDSDIVWLAVREGDTEESVSQQIFGDQNHTQRVRRLGGSSEAHGPMKGGDLVAVSLRPIPIGAHSAGEMSGVTILCYHRLGHGQASRSKMEVASNDFKAQMHFLLDNGYHVIPLRKLEAYLAGVEELPERSVVITFDDGYRSLVTEALPTLDLLKLPATVFIYLDFVGSPDAVTMADLEKLSSGGVIDVQYHSKTHQDLASSRPGEGAAARRRRIKNEFDSSALLAARAKIPAPTYFAFPYGAVNGQVLKVMGEGGRWRLGLTVLPGREPSWADPMLLRRTMVFGSDDLESFAAKLSGPGRSISR